MLLNQDRQTLLARRGATLPAIRLLDQLPLHAIITAAKAEVAGSEYQPIVLGPPA